MFPTYKRMGVGIFQYQLNLWNKAIFDALEKKVIVPFAADPRVHMVLVCAAVGCPVIERAAYAGSNMDKAMDAAAEQFASLDDATLHQVVAGNAARVFGFDLEPWARSWMAAAGPAGAATVVGLLAADVVARLTEADEGRDHGEGGREFPEVLANTTSAFGLGDYEWILAFEADSIDRLVELIRHLRANESRRYVKEETPFVTGIRKPLPEAITDLPF